MFFKAVSRIFSRRTDSGWRHPHPDGKAVCAARQRCLCLHWDDFGVLMTLPRVDCPTPFEFDLSRTVQNPKRHMSRNCHKPLSNLVWTALWLCESRNISIWVHYDITVMPTRAHHRTYQGAWQHIRCHHRTSTTLDHLRSIATVARPPLCQSPCHFLPWK